MMSFDSTGVGGSTFAKSRESLSCAQGTLVQASATYLLTGLSAGNRTFTAKYTNAVGTGIASFNDRHITVIALP